MSKQVVKLVQPSAQKEVVAEPTRLLKQAKAGELLFIAYATELKGGDVAHAWTSTYNAHYLKSGVLSLAVELAAAK